MRTRVKICGLTRKADAMAVWEAGADAIGLVFHPGSPRYLSPSAAEDLVRELPPFLGRVGVFVNPTEAQVREAVVRAGLTAIQLHGEETPAFCARFAPLPVIKAFRIRDEDSLENLRRYRHVQAWLLDAWHPSARGGTGERFDWAWARQAMEHRVPVILAGGLSPENAAEAVRTVRPFALDVSSGVESAPGRKAPERIHAFMRAVREAEAALPTAEPD